MSEFAGMRDRVERPAYRAGANVVRPDVSGCSTLLFANPHPLDQQILVNDAGARRDEVGVADVTRQSSSEVDRTGIAERANGPAGAGVERVKTATGGEEDSPLASVRPVHHAAIHMSQSGARCVVRGAWVELPD